VSHHSKSDPSKCDDDIARIDREAAAWLARRDRGLQAHEQDEFLQWLAADPRHGEWLARHQRTWSEFDRLAQWRPEHSSEPNPDLLARHRPAPRLRWLIWAAPLATAAGVVILFFFNPARAPSTATVPEMRQTGAVTGHSHLLEDGSTLDVRENSEFIVRFSASERRVDLVRGEAFFTVAKDPRRPFIVHANGVDVRAVGTAFNVRVGRAAVEVLVTEGKVQLAALAPPSEDPTDSPPAEPPRYVTAGERAFVSITATVAPPRVAAVSGDEIARELAWQPRLFDFNSTPLSEVVRDFNARNRMQMVIADPQLAMLPIIASVRSDNVDGFVRLLEATAGIRAERREGIILLHAHR
jgi:transmembrane sensor